MEMPQENDSPLKLTQGEFAKNLNSFPHSQILGHFAAARYPRMRLSCASARRANCVGWPPSLDRTFVIDWRVMHLGFIRCKAATFFVFMIGSKQRVSGNGLLKNRENRK